jgi:hypothetical protein
MVAYRFDEKKYFEELKQYIDETYSGHYQKGIPVADFIMSNLETADFFKGNVLKYITRYGRKNGHDKADLLKAVHYIFFMLYYHDQKTDTGVN